MALFTLSSPYRDENRSLIAALKAATFIYKLVAFLDVSNIEHLYNGSRSILETVKYMHLRHLLVGSAMLCRMQNDPRAVHIATNGSCYEIRSCGYSSLPRPHGM